jgi:GT2 family glycosyltransferase
VHRCDIVIPVWNQLEATRDCVESIIKNTSYPYRLIIVDNGGNSQTKAYLESLSARSGLAVVLVRNEKNLGFVKAVNQGFNMSDADYICVLNNDTIVMKDWLGEMIRMAESSGDIGIVNPSSNNLGQRPEKGEPLELFAEKMRENSGHLVELGAAIGFCMLIKREVVRRIGFFDEIYGMGNFEDTDFSRRAAREGYRSVRACGAYVYHRENTSFSKVKAFEEDFKRNKEIYEFRWGKPKRIAYVLGSSDRNLLKRLGSESIKLARAGNWVWYYSTGDIEIPDHSNIISVSIPERFFYFKTAVKILTKKKKFDEIFVGEERFGNILERFSGIHGAKVGYY